ncbi:FAD-dependent oxidoreductase [Actinoplanes hulinensis]|uniref:FAD-dependent oxidoreductase n=1 Tax=Actinoplanes hulinensis TaxID=1144547 RepID=A0ABS7B521_9ACTN|nr:NAD(P)/FAD-dependent oxidoreductase [Actinoplanes hulinensis]MBW6436095.1 FAD-dependent oxidoreductase [Actinoplanes hulinensis]
MNERTSKVVIVGAGIGGLAAAVALRRAGIPVTVYERAAELGRAQAGHGLVLWHNAVLALRALGLGKEIAEIGYALDRHQFWTWYGPNLADWPLDEGAARTGAPVYTVSRPALHRMLLDAAGGDVVLGHTYAGHTEDDDGVTVRFGNGRTVRAGLLVGADGLRSGVRAALMPYEPPPVYAGFTAFQGVIDTGVPGVRDHAFVSTWGRGRWFVYYRLADGRIYWDGILGDRRVRRLSGVGGGRRELLLGEFAGWPAPITGLIGATGEEGIVPAHIFHRPPVDRWSTGRVTLLGDAAHPMTFNLGQGAGQSIEDAVVLAQCLGRSGELAEYERRRAGRVRRIANRSRANGEFTRWHSLPACLFRDAFMRLTFDRLVRRKTYQLTMRVDFVDS